MQSSQSPEKEHVSKALKTSRRIPFSDRLNVSFALRPLSLLFAIFALKGLVCQLARRYQISNFSHGIGYGSSRNSTRERPASSRAFFSPFSASAVALSRTPIRTLRPSLPSTDLAIATICSSETGR